MQRLAALLGVVVLLAFSGCPPTYPKCKNDEACKEHNEVCVQGQCQECADNGNCKAGFVCEANKCVPHPECSADAQCPAGSRCSAGKCSDACQKDGDCSAGKCRANHCVMNACTKKSDCPGGQECEEGICTARTAGACQWTPVHFDFNDVALSAEARSQLEPLAECIKSAKGKVTLEGHADERGTEEYNLQLSSRRAAAVKKYLSDLGVPAAKLESVGYGANRPVNKGHTEEAWAANRRVELKH